MIELELYAQRWHKVNGHRAKVLTKDSFFLDRLPRQLVDSTCTT